MKKILFINTGGTIASVPGGNGLSPLSSGIDPVCQIPELNDICSVRSISLFSLDSTDIRPSHWLEISSAIKSAYEQYDGFVIAHGTDTMAYTAAGLSVLIENSRKPVVLTGSQIPAYCEDSDARKNLIMAFTYAASDKAFGVHVVFAGHVINGTRVRKVRTNSADSMESINAPDDAYFKDGVLHVNVFPDSCPDRTVFRNHLNENICIVKLYPGIDRGFLEYAYDHYDGMVLETFGCGGIPVYAMFGDIVRSSARRIPVVICTQVMYEGTDLQRYEVGRRLLELPNIIEGSDMTSEAAFAGLAAGTLLP